MAYQILIVDDDQEFREEMRECLESYRIIEAADGLQALEILKKPHAIDLVILDVMMPSLRGTEALKQIKKLSPDLAVIISTGQSSKDVAIEALKGHADDYIEKPFVVEKFLASVQRVLDSKNKSLTAHLNKMQRVKIFIERNFDKKISLEQAAQEVCLSPKYLSRIFKENTGFGFNDYRLKIKIQKSEDLLKKSSDTIERISIQLGYKNVESFIRMFEQFKGCTPTEYRRKHDGQNRKKK